MKPVYVRGKIVWSHCLDRETNELALRATYGCCRTHHIALVSRILPNWQQLRNFSAARKATRFGMYVALMSHPLIKHDIERKQRKQRNRNRKPN